MIDEGDPANGSDGRADRKPAGFSMVDDPSPIAALGVWRAFLARQDEALQAEPDDVGLQLAVKRARRWIAWKESVGETE
jgi:hypothetical protein